jgi:S-adenosylmethionine/arginine decarboxylase-like enzyme
MKRLRTTQINLYDCYSDIIFSKEEINLFLERLVDFIGMRVIPEKMIENKNPHSFEFIPSELNLPDVEAGITGTITLFESHAALHLWNNTRFVCVVISSCKDYDPDSVANYCQSYLSAGDLKVSTMYL